METMGWGSGLGAAAFWAFLAIIIAAGIWYAAHRSDAQQETLRHLIDSGQPLDEALVDKLLDANGRLDRSLKAAGVILLFIAPGVAILGWLLARLDPWVFTALLGAAIVIGCAAFGLLAAAGSIRRSYHGSRGHRRHRRMR